MDQILVNDTGLLGDPAAKDLGLVLLKKADKPCLLHADSSTPKGVRLVTAHDYHCQSMTLVDAVGAHCCTNGVKCPTRASAAFEWVGQVMSQVAALITLALKRSRLGCST